MKKAAKQAQYKKKMLKKIATEIDVENPADNVK